MTQDLLKAGEFARLTRTTKRTVHWYDRKGVLSPAEVNGKGYRLYRPEQIIDFQVLYLLTKLGFSLSEVRSYLKKKSLVKEMFASKRVDLRKQIENLQETLRNIEIFYGNFEKTSSLVNPVVKKHSEFNYYYFPKEGPYSKIAEYFSELKLQFEAIPKDPTFLTIFEEKGFHPKKAKMKIGVFATEGLIVKEGSELLRDTLPKRNVLTYTHLGSSHLLSLLWNEMSSFRKRNGYKFDPRFPFYLEITRPNSIELQIPVL